MNEIEAISVLETRIKYPNSDTYGGMCEAEYQQEAVVLAIEALREKAERESGCEWCKTPSHNPDIGDAPLCFTGAKRTQSGHMPYPYRFLMNMEKNRNQYLCGLTTVFIAESDWRNTMRLIDADALNWGGYGMHKVYVLKECRK